MKKFLIDVGHPAHIHLFRNFIKGIESKGHFVLVVSRNRDIMNKLLDYYNINYISISNYKQSKFSLLLELFNRTHRIFKLNKNQKFDMSLGTSVSLGFLSTFKKVPSYNFLEDDDDVDPILCNISYPFNTKIVNPDCLKFRKWKDKRILYNSYHELAYLHPNNFTPDESILKKYNLEKKKYVIIRLNSLKAHHDVGAKGISNELYTKIKEILKDYTIIESKENSKTHQIEPWDMHHVLAYAKMIVCDSQTMAAEAMVLGTPSIRINTFVGRISYLEELENKYNLGYGFLPTYENEEKILSTIQNLITDKDIETIWQSKRQNMLSEKCDLNQWMIENFEKEIKI